MKVVFLQDVPSVAQAGEVKDVANGYARNFLFPKKLAALATPGEMRRLEDRQQSESRRQAVLEHEAEALAQELGGITVTLKVRSGTTGRIYGSVTNTAIAREIKRLTGHDIDKHVIELEEPIKVLGSHQVSLKLTRNVTATVNVLVEQKEEEAEEKKEKKPKEKVKAEEPKKKKKEKKPVADKETEPEEEPVAEEPAEEEEPEPEPELEQEEAEASAEGEPEPEPEAEAGPEEQVWEEAEEQEEEEEKE